MRAGAGSILVVAVALLLAACPRPRDDAADTGTAATTATIGIAPSPSPSPFTVASSASPSPSPSPSPLVVAGPDAQPPSFALLPERIATIARDPSRASPQQKQDGPAATTYVVPIPGVRSAAVAVIHGRPDAWSFSIYADGVKPSDFGKLKDLSPTPGGGRRWVVLDGPLRGAELFLSPNDASLVVLQSATFRDATE